MVRRGPIATVEVGVETKILAKAMIKQIDRVIGDLERQVDEFRKLGGTPICIGIVGINHALSYTSYEGERPWPTDGRRQKHPQQEAGEAERRINEKARRKFDELLLIRFRATNVDPFPFEWVDQPTLEAEYGAMLVRLSREYDRRFH